jgi:hypothetical protein
MIVDFLPSHLLEIDLQPAQKYLEPSLFELGQNYHAMGPARTIVDGENILCCCGLLAYPSPVGVKPWKAVVWTMLSNIEQKQFLKIHRGVQRLLNEFGREFKRVEATVDIDFEQGHRWMKALGFVVEANRMKYSGLAGDQTLYAKYWNEL